MIAEKTGHTTASVSPNGLVKRLQYITEQQRPVYKIVLSNLEGALGQLFYRKAPPKKGSSALLHLGCGDHHFPEWVNADYYRFSDLLRKKRGLPDWMLDLSQPWNCPDNYWEGIYTEHTFEHVNYSGVILALLEAKRTLKTGRWIRIVLPGLDKFWQSEQYRFKAEAISCLTQVHGHVSVWDESLLSALLTELGFRNVKVVSFGEGSDAAIIKDLQSRRHESIYLEAQK